MKGITLLKQLWIVIKVSKWICLILFTLKSSLTYTGLNADNHNIFIDMEDKSCNNKICESLLIIL